MVPRSILAAVLLAILTACSPVKAPRSAAAVPEQRGAVVETVAPQAMAAVAGLLPGDVILSWSSAVSRGDVRSPYDLLPAEIEEAPRRAVTLRGRRGGEEKTWEMVRGDWGMAVRPAGDGHAAFLLDRRARQLSDERKWAEADAAYQEAVEALKREAGPAAAAHLLRAWGSSFQFRGELAAAVERYERALALTGPKSLSTAHTLAGLAQTRAKMGDIGAGEELLRQALAIQEEVAPGTTDVAETLNKLGVLARWRGDLETAGEHLKRAEELQRRLAPGSAGHGRVFINLGNVAQERGDHAEAESFHRQALAVFERIEPYGGYVAGCLQNLVNVEILRGDLASADDLLRRILELQERRGGSEWEAWSTLTNLGHIAVERGDLEAAEVHYRRALAIQEKKPSPGGRDLAQSLGNVGEVALLKGDRAMARDYLQRALEIEEALAPEGLGVATSLENLAHLETQSGDPARAEAMLRRALAIFEKKAPESLEASLVMRHLGEVMGQRGRPEEAAALHRRAIGIQSRLAQWSSELAETLYYLGRAERRSGQNGAGIRNLCRAVDTLDRQRTRIGGTPEARTSFEATLGEYYHACMEGRLELGQSAEAFHVLERSRARSFLALLAERDFRPSDLPPELAAERRHVNAEYDRVQSQLALLKAGPDDAEIDRLTDELQALRLRQEEISERIRRESPRSAALHDPEPLDLAGVRAVLDPGTVLLEYAVGEEKSWLFVVDAADTADTADTADLSVFPIAIGAERLREEVESFRLLLKDPGSDSAEIKRRGRRLYDLLVRPAEARIAGAERLLVSPDGPLHTLAFAALRREDGRNSGYLVEWKPLHNVLSATVYGELARSRRPAGPAGDTGLAAFGDPVYRLSEQKAADPELRGLALARLPFSAREVKSIADLYPRAEVYLGRDATEEKAKSLGPEARLVHFACHGILDERFPLNSALVLTLPEEKAEGQDNGLLQAWEIFESVRLDADLVTLSACDTALGREMGGEGLVGLTRAFQYAGARSVLASLWSVADVSTARFMKSFYGHLRGGKSKDEALREAQLEQAREAHPFHWAAFQLTGDWR